jgi:hypothetical protein
MTRIAVRCIRQVVPCAAERDSPAISGKQTVPFDLNVRMRFFCAVTKNTDKGDGMPIALLLRTIPW